MDKDESALKSYIKRIKSFFNDFKKYIKRRHAIAVKTGTDGSAGRIRGKSIAIYAEALSRIEIAIDSFKVFGIANLRGYINRINDALAIEKEADIFAAEKTPEHALRARNMHMKLSQQTDRMLLKSNEIKDMEKISPYVDILSKEENQPLTVMPMFNSKLVKERELLMSDFAENAAAAKGELPKVQIW